MNIIAICNRENRVLEIIEDETESIKPGMIIPLEEGIPRLQLNDQVYYGRLIVLAGEDRILLVPGENHSLEEVLISITSHYRFRVTDIQRTVELERAEQKNKDDETYNRLTELNNELITTRRELSRKNMNLDRMNHELNEVNRELESFSYSVSHDLRAPLRIITGYIHHLMNPGEETCEEERYSILERIHANAKHMQEMINALLDISRQTRKEIERSPVDISSVAESIIHDMKKYEPDRRVQTEIEPGIIVNADPDLSRIVLENLIGNAWKYSAKKEIAIIRLYLDSNGRICLEDNGAGFSESKAEDLFNVFHRAHDDKEFSGLGVGLATVKRIIHRHRGRIEASGMPDEGATFCFTME
jgi:light-regulated signal transduction histidine kinase (bacteriophytochrome)